MSPNIWWEAASQNSNWSEVGHNEERGAATLAVAPQLHPLGKTKRCGVRQGADELVVVAPFLWTSTPTMAERTQE